MEYANKSTINWELDRTDCVIHGWQCGNEAERSPYLWRDARDELSFSLWNFELYLKE